jgi:hypothetical protein
MLLKKPCSFSLNADRAPQLNANVMFLPLLKTVLLVAVGLSISSTSAEPSIPKCGYETPVQMLNRSSAVFSGRVVQVNGSEQTQIVTLTVTNSWKGVRSNQVTLTNVVHHESAFFREGHSYLVFAYGRDGNLTNGPCSGTGELEFAGRSVRSLNRWKAHHRSGRR